jgi:hypothetical protein
VHAVSSHKKVDADYFLMRALGAGKKSNMLPVFTSKGEKSSNEPLCNTLLIKQSHGLFYSKKSLKRAKLLKIKMTKLVEWKFCMSEFLFVLI